MALKTFNSPGGYSTGDLVAGAITVILANGDITTTNGTFSGNLSGNYVSGNGAFLTGIQYNNIIGAYSNANVSSYLGSNTNIVLALGTGNITTQGNIAGGYILGNGYFLSGITANYGNANVAAYLPTYTGNLYSLTGNVTTTANISGGYILGNGSFLTGIAANYGNANVANYLPTYSGNLNTVGNIIATGVIAAAGALSGLSLTTSFDIISGSGNVTAAGNITATGGNVQGSYILGNGYFLTGLGATYSNANVAAYLPTYTGNLAGGNLYLTGGAVIAGNLDVKGNVTFIESNVVTINDNNINLANNAATAAQANGAGITIGPIGAGYAGIDWVSTSNTWILNSTNVGVTALNATSVSASQSVTGNDVVANAYFQVGATSIGQGTLPTSSTSTQTIANVPTATGQAVEFLVKGYDTVASYYQVSTINAINDGAAVDYTQFGAVALPQAIGTLSVALSGGGTILQVTPTSANAMIWTTQYRVM